MIHYSLSLRFNESNYNLVCSILHELKIDSYEEGEASEDIDGNFSLINENSFIKIRSESKSQLENILSVIPNEKLESHSLESHNDDYLNEWKKYSNPIQVTNNILIKPSWIEEEIKSNAKYVISLDAGYAFGSGTHETTRLCLEELESLSEIRKGASLLDVGCGSGILSIAASMLGYDPIVGIDIDSLAIEASKDNASKNNIKNVNFLDTPINKISDSYDVVVANIITSGLFEIKEQILKKIKPGGALILSGILKEEKNKVLQAFNLSNVNVREMNEWIAISLYNYNFLSSQN